MTKDATIYGMSLFNSPADKLAEIHTALDPARDLTRVSLTA